MDLLDKKYRILNGFNDLLGMFRDIESIAIEMKDMEVCQSIPCKLCCYQHRYQVIDILDIMCIFMYISVCVRACVHVCVRVCIYV